MRKLILALLSVFFMAGCANTEYPREQVEIVFKDGSRDTSWVSVEHRIVRTPDRLLETRTRYGGERVVALDVKFVRILRNEK